MLPLGRAQHELHIHFASLSTLRYFDKYQFTLQNEFLFMCVWVGGCVGVCDRDRKRKRERENISELKKDMYNIHNTDELFLNRSLLLEEN